MTEQQQNNSRLNIQEIDEGATVLKSYPRRLVLELTNACNMNCMMCGRNAAEFKIIKNIINGTDVIYNCNEENLGIRNADGVKLGYVPKKDNVIFARLMDAGKLLFGRITKKEW